MNRTGVFLTNRSQAVRLRKDVAFPPEVKDVVVFRSGRARVIAPVGSAWDDFFDSPGIDLAPREQPPPQEREPL